MCSSTLQVAAHPVGQDEGLCDGISNLRFKIERSPQEMAQGCTNLGQAEDHWCFRQWLGWCREGLTRSRRGCRARRRCQRDPWGPCGSSRWVGHGKHIEYCHGNVGLREHKKEACPTWMIWTAQQIQRNSCYCRKPWSSENPSFLLWSSRASCCCSKHCNKDGNLTGTPGLQCPPAPIDALRRATRAKKWTASHLSWRLFSGLSFHFSQN